MNKMKHFLAKAIVKVVEKVLRSYEKVNLYYLRGEFKHIGANAHIERRVGVMNPQCISIGNNFTARSGAMIRAFTSWEDKTFTPEFLIGDGVHLAIDCTINCTHRIEIGNNCGLGVGSKVMDHMHGHPEFQDLEVPLMKRALTSRGAVKINDNVMIGAGVVIMPGVEIGENSIVGSNSVVTKSIPPNSIAAGVPAKVIKTIQLSTSDAV
jgi:acetyltransferase-like isoleucine patch superfamily enzyme